MLNLVAAFAFLNLHSKMQNRELKEKSLYVGIAKGKLKSRCDMHEDTLPQDKFG